VLHQLLDPTYLLQLFGYIGLAVIVFSESGLLVGFFLPGDTLLITAGIFASQGHLNIMLTLAIIIVAAIIGDSVGYFIGSKVGPKLFTRPDSRFFSQKNVQEAHAFFEKYGAQSIILARFLPIIRSFVPTIAGVSKLSYKKFLTYNIIGGTLWGLVVTMLGYTLGRVIPNMDHYILPVVITVSIVSFIPLIVHLQKRRRPKAKEVADE
jgi:membrane-associated protein